MFFPSAKIIVHDPLDQTKILLIKRTVNGIISYEPAGGRAEINYSACTAESLEECVVREAAEELGYTVQVERYIGSYSYFWPHDLGKCSCYAIFSGVTTKKIEQFTGNSDNDCWPVEPEWVNIDDIMQGRIAINPTHKGLKELVMQAIEKSSSY